MDVEPEVGCVLVLLGRLDILIIHCSMQDERQGCEGCARDGAYQSADREALLQADQGMSHSKGGAR
jgi:hypothetical protein